MHTDKDSPQAAQCDACLVMLPFGPIRTPSLGLGLLKGVGMRHGYEVNVRYSNLLFASRVGVELYESICEGNPSTVVLLGEWLMAHAMKSHRQEDIDSYVLDVVLKSQYASKRGRERDAEFVAKLRLDISEILPLVEPFITHEAEAICATGACLVGLTSTFQQNMACLAIARRVKEISPSTFVVMGGANAEGVMGRRIKAEYPFLD